ncbi:MAG: SIMPL domain-containing protein [Candidatus Bathyarchaeia archaeon]
MNKGNYLTALAIIALVIVSVFAIMRPTMIARGPENPNQKTITVNGTGTVETAPDEALLNLAVNTQAPTADQAAKENANTMSNVMQAILGLSSLNPSIAKDDITTTDYSLTPVYSQANNCLTASSPQQPITCTTTTQQLVGYSVRNAIQVTIKDMTSIGRVLDAATQSGVNEVGGITFTFTDGTYASLQKQALQKAVQDASNQAQTLATALGVQVTGVVSVTPAYVYQPYVSAKLNVPSSGTPIQTGSLQVTVNVQVVYEISA